MATTTTTTTTTPIGYIHPLLDVITTAYSLETPPKQLIDSSSLFYNSINEAFLIIQKTNASDSPNTKGSIYPQSISFGTLAPGETSKTIAVSLSVPNCKSITNIKLSLIDASNIQFTNSTFGIGSSSFLSKSITTESYFTGINIQGSSTSPYNISIPNKTNNISYYVYLNINTPIDNAPGPAILRYKWFFDYAE